MDMRVPPGRVASCLTTGKDTAVAIPIILDCDPGTDDAFAILLALASPELDVLAITVAGGNVGLECTLPNALALVALAGADVPVYAGADRPLLGAFVNETRVHGVDGLGGVALPAGGEPAAGVAADAIRRLLRDAAQQVTLVGIAPATNLALALITEPALAEKVERIVLMTGAWGEGNATPAAEFNAFNDPEALAVLFACGRPVVLATLELTAQALCTPAHLASFRAGGTGRCMAALCDIQATVPLGPRLGGAGVGAARPVRDRLADPPRPVHHARLRRDGRPWTRAEPRTHGDRPLATHRRAAQCHRAGDARRRWLLCAARRAPRASAVVAVAIRQPPSAAAPRCSLGPAVARSHAAASCPAPASSPAARARPCRCNRSG